MNTSLKIRLLGSFQVLKGDKALSIQSRSAQALLAYLLLKPRAQHRREKIAAEIWPEANEENSRAYLRNSLWQLRKALGAGYFHADKNLVALDPSASYKLDVDRLLELKGKSASREGLMRALDGFQGELLPGFYDDWVVTEREHLNRLFVSHFTLLLEKLQAERLWPELIEWGEKFVAYEEAPEEAFCILMQAYAETGDRSNLTSTYQRCVRHLDQQLSFAPSAKTVELYQSLLRQKPAGQKLPAGPAPRAVVRPQGKKRRSPTPVLLLGALSALGFSALMFNLSPATPFESLAKDSFLGVSEVSPFPSGASLSSFQQSQLLANVPSAERKELRVATDGTIRISSTDGSKYEIVKPRDLFVMGASWLPDGQRLLIWADPRGNVAYLGQGNFFIINEDGTGIVQLTSDGDTELKGPPSLSSDGTKILYSDGGGITILNLQDGSLQSVITTDNGLSWIPDAKWSPDDSKIVFVRMTPNCDCDAIFRITVINSDGTDPRELYATPLGSKIVTQSVGFSADGRLVGFEALIAGSEPLVWRYYTVSLEGVEAPEITSLNIYTWLPTFFPQWED